MFETLKTSLKDINLYAPVVQTGLITAGTYVTGKIFGHTVIPQTAAVITGTAALVAAVVSKLYTQNDQVDYAVGNALSTLAGVAAGLAAHRFIYPGVNVFNSHYAVISCIFSASLLAIKFFAAPFPRPRVDVIAG